MRFKGEDTVTRKWEKGDGDRELRVAIEGYGAGNSMREIAGDVYGAEMAAADWRASGWLAARMRRRVRGARTRGNEG